MERIKKLSRYQKGVILLMLVMSIVFLVLYARTISRVGFEYLDAILVPSQENGSTVYSGTINGQQARFTVSEDQTVVYQYGDQTFGPYYVTSEGLEGDANGQVMDPAEPSESAILQLLNGPELTHQGDWLAWLGAVVICVLNALSIIFADELFQWNMQFQVRNADHVEPSAWEMAGRNNRLAVFAVAAFVLFMEGLR